mmetsp:Transcript_37233/g.37918  ORF Transcript_37233/g.37918 Transcript_37233/m.37918 type:complete len:223 (+) Transcript_37233:301-969(+)|eukprot:CAMPEP_0182425218 /NCGR_PEP_ID=MMETSP1167-20130531/11568_1 /TAXON_ID=2988 /ORGANISM="Mallomonas Sp, Strain CCMP3275" /LENGTH=222 /DNA_ID=CAMNT_0024605693 /DNA_START=271 /DNA_END=939 /DNA_ORIENTATION=-
MSRINWNEQGGLLGIPLKFDPCYPGPYTIVEEESKKIVVTTEPGPGCVFTTLFFWAIPCFISEMKATRLEFFVTDNGLINCEVRKKTAFGDVPTKYLHDVTCVRTREGDCSGSGKNDCGESLPYTPCVFLINYSEGQFRAFEGAGHFDQVVSGLCRSVNGLIQEHRREEVPPSLPSPSHMAENTNNSTVYAHAQSLATGTPTVIHPPYVTLQNKEEDLEYNI